MEPITLVALLGIASTLTIFRALHRQTHRADRAEAALARVEAVITDEARHLRVDHVAKAVRP